MTDSWPAPRCSKFKGESPEAYQRRVAEVATIQEGFRMGRYRGDLAEHMERRLIYLQEHPLFETMTA